MKAIVQDRYGAPDQVLRLLDVPKPQAGPGQVLIRVRAASVHPDVWHVITGRPWILRLMGGGFSRPKQSIPGTDLSGTVEAVGPGVTRLAVGEDVFGESHGAFQWTNGGAFAEYAVVPESSLVHKPKDLSFEAAASVPSSGIIALMNLGFVEPLRPGHHILINGAGGGVGSIALQAAKDAGAVVTAVETSARLDHVRSLGADHVIDARDGITGGDARYDLIFDVASNLSLPDCRRVLKPDGKYLIIGHDHYGKSAGRILGSLPKVMGQMLLALVDKTLPKPSFKTPPKIDLMNALKGLLEKGALKPTVGRIYALAEVPQALRDLQQGQVLGKLIITP